MRIITGSAKGRQLKVPDISNLRPSQDAVRQMIFSIIGERIKNATCLDLFAGTGALGIEALSRRAQRCDFVEKSPEAVRIIIENLKHCQLEGKAEVHQAKVHRFLQSPSQTYDFIFLDPPYREPVFDLFDSLAGSLNEGGILIYLHPKKLNFPEPLPGNLKLTDQRSFGATTISFLELAS